MSSHITERNRFIFQTGPAIGLTFDQARALLRKAQTLHTWAVHECNGTKRREERETSPGTWEETGRVHWYNPDTGKRCGLTPDLERGALKSAAAICNEAGLEFEHQGDPRGYVLKIIKDGRAYGVPSEG
jgi:hypothetical protein